MRFLFFTEKRDAYWERIASADFLTAEEKRKLLGIGVENASAGNK